MNFSLLSNRTDKFGSSSLSIEFYACSQLDNSYLFIIATFLLLTTDCEFLKGRNHVLYTQ